MAKRPRKRIFDLVGESHYQGALLQCDPGAVVELVREPDNPHDPNAIAAKLGAQTLGYVAASDAAELAPVMDAGSKPKAIVYEITGCIPDYPTIGCRIALQWEGDEPRKHKQLDPEQIAFRKHAGGGEAKAKSGCLGMLALALLPIGLAAMQWA